MNAEIKAIMGVFKAQRVRARVSARIVTPGFVMYGIQRHPEERVLKIENVLPEIRNALTAIRGKRTPVRFSPDPIFLEVPRPDPQPMPWSVDLAQGPHVAVAGKSFDMGNASILAADFNEPDLAHILIAAASGGGKTVLMQGMLATMAISTPPAECRYILIDPKRRGLLPFRGLPHVLRFAVTPDEVQSAVEMVIEESANRRDRPNQTPPRWMVWIDELAQLPKESLKALNEVALPLGREQRINIVSATQHPTAEILGGSLAKVNYSARMIGRVVDGQVAATATGRGKSGAEFLPGRGAFLHVDGADMVRFQAYMLSDADLTRCLRLSAQKWATVPTPKPASAQPETPAMPPELATLAELAAKHYDADRCKWRHGTKTTVLRAVFGEIVPIGGNAGKIYTEKLENMMENLGNFPKIPQSHQW